MNLQALEKDLLLALSSAFEYGFTPAYIVYMLYAVTIFFSKLGRYLILLFSLQSEVLNRVSQKYQWNIIQLLVICFTLKTICISIWKQLFLFLLCICVILDMIFDSKNLIFTKISPYNEINMTTSWKYNSLQVIKILPLIRNLFKMNRFLREILSTGYKVLRFWLKLNLWFL